MAIIHCPSCNRRISSLAKSCPYCHAPIGELNQEERERLILRRWRTRLYRARNVTYLAMTLVVIGMLWWWLAPPSGLALPAPLAAAFLLGLGLVLYLAGWCWLLWLRLSRNR
ncbi:MAG: hypothetical protein AAF446_07730 [Pseudomonadota bacterium]